MHAPGYYLHIDPEQVFLAAGIWRPEAATLGKIRDRIAARPQDWTKVVSDRRFKKHFQLSGSSLTRPPRGYANDHPHIQDLKRKDFIGVTDLSHKDLFGQRFVKDVERTFRAADPLMRFLCKAAEAPF